MNDYNIGYFGDTNDCSSYFPNIVNKNREIILAKEAKDKEEEERIRREKELYKEREILNTFVNDNDTRLSKTMERLRMKLNKRKA